MAKSVVVNVHPALARRFCNQIEIVGLSSKKKTGGYRQLSEGKFALKVHNVYVVRSHILRDRIRKDPVTGRPVTVHVDRECVFEIREDVLRARYNLDGTTLPR